MSWVGVWYWVYGCCYVFQRSVHLKCVVYFGSYYYFEFGSSSCLLLSSLYICLALRLLFFDVVNMVLLFMNLVFSIFPFYSRWTGRFRLHVIDLDPASVTSGGWLEDTSLVEKFEISEEAYNKRGGMSLYPRSQENFFICTSFKWLNVHMCLM